MEIPLSLCTTQCSAVLRPTENTDLRVEKGRVLVAQFFARGLFHSYITLLVISSDRTLPISVNHYQLQQLDIGQGGLGGINARAKI